MGHYNHSIPVDTNIMVSSSFLSYKRLKLKLRVFLAGHIAAMVTYCATKLAATCSPMIGQFIDTMMLASTGIEWL